MVNLSGRTEYPVEDLLGLVKRLEISKELIRECVTVPGCCCCMPLLHNHLMDSCSYVRKIAKGGCICTPLTPPKSATAAAASGTVNWPLFDTILFRRSGRTRSASFKVTAIVLLKISSCKDKAQKLLETGNVILQDGNTSGS